MKKLKSMGVLLLAGVLAFSGTIPCLAATADELNDAQEEKAATETQLQTAQDRIAALEAQKGESEAYLTELNSQLTDLTSEIDALQAQYVDKQHELDTTAQELADANVLEVQQRSDMAVRIQYMYENSTNTGILESLFSATSFSDFLDRATNVSALTSYDREMLEQYGAVIQDIEDKQAEQKQEEAEIENLLSQSADKKEQLQVVYESTAEEVNRVAESLEGEQSTVAALLASIQQQEANIQTLTERNQLEQQAAQAAAQAAQSEAYTESTAAYSASDDSYTETDDSAQNTSAGASYEEPASSWSGQVLTLSAGFVQGPSGGETYYNLDMSGVVSIMRAMGNYDEYWVRSDGVKMLGPYVMCAANLSLRPRGSLVQSSLGMAIVCDTGGFASVHPDRLDIAVAW